MLTRKQRELLKFIQERLADSGISPSFDEMKEALGLKSKSGVHRLITGLEERGFIRRLPHRARALDVVRLPDDQTAKAAPVAARAGEERRAGLNVIRGDFTPSLPGAVVAAQPSQALQLPLYGKIAAGTPIEALRDNSAAVDVPANLVGRGEHYALTVEGDSMVDEGILDGDFALIRKVDTARDGEIVVALVNNEEATLKTFRREGNMIRLDPANRHYEPQRYRPEQVQIQGKLTGLVRRY